VPVLLADSGLAFVQSRWGHANRGANWLTATKELRQAFAPTATPEAATPAISGGE